MKKFLLYLTIISVGFAISIILNSNESSARSVAPASIVDYYLLLPDETFQCETAVPLSKKHKTDLIKKKDLKNNFITASTMDGGYPLEVALFVDDYLGVKVLAANVRCQSGCMCKRLDLFFVSGGKVMKSSAEGLFPKAEDIEKAAKIKDGYGFEIAGDGKSIKVVSDDSNKTLLIIEWSGGTFNLPN